MRENFISNDCMNLRRGDVYIADIPYREGSKCQCGKRPVVIISNDMNNKFGAVIHFVPLTTKLKKLELPTHALLESDFLKDPSMALCEQTEMMDKNEFMNILISKRKGKLNDVDMDNIGYGVGVQFGIVFVRARVRENTCIA